MIQKQTRSMEAVKDYLNHVQSNEMSAIINIQNNLLKILQDFAFERGFKQIMPLLMSPITDPLNHKVYPAEINYEDRRLKLTASMIFHKQLALVNRAYDKIFIMAPNIRLELASEKSSDNHLLEFSQFDIEMRNASMDEVMELIEELYIHIFQRINELCPEELKVLKRKLPNIDGLFNRYTTEGVPLDQVDDFCNQISEKETKPAFITSFKREFYDKEDPSRPGIYKNFDIVYPEGYGEGLSGAEREYEYEQIVRRMKELNMDLAPYENYLSIAESGKLPSTAGCGIGIQRLLKFICGKRAIKDVCLFDRSVRSEFNF